MINVWIEEYLIQDFPCFSKILIYYFFKYCTYLGTTTIYTFKLCSCWSRNLLFMPLLCTLLRLNWAKQAQRQGGEINDETCHRVGSNQRPSDQGIVVMKYEEFITVTYLSTNETRQLGRPRSPANRFRN